MMLKNKLILNTALSVIVATIGITAGASILNYSQTKRQNTVRLENAWTHFSAQFQTMLDQTYTNLDDFTSDSMRTSKFVFAAMTDATGKEVPELIVSLAEVMNANVTFYMKDEDDKNRLTYYTYDKEVGAIYAEDEEEHRLFYPDKEGFMTDRYIENPKVFPEFYPEFEQPIFLTSEEEGLTVSIYHPYTNTSYEDVSMDAIKGSHVGNFFFRKHLDIDLDNLGEQMGVGLTLFDANGVQGIGKNLFSQIETLPDSSEPSVIDLEDEQGEHYDSLLLPLSHKDQMIGYVAITISQVETVNKIRETVILLLIIAAVILALVLASTFYLVSSITGPLVNLNRIFSEIAEGGGNLTIRIPVQNKDEIGGVAESFNKFVSHISEMILQQRGMSNQLAGVADQQMTVSEELNQANSTVVDNTQTITSAMREIDSISHELTQHSNDIISKTNTMSEIVAKTNQTVDKGNHLVQEMNQSMEQISSNTNDIVQTLKVIQAIAKQTNLLSLNAAIESAKAGEQGKGFAVVASEVRVLADKSSQASKEISQLIDISGQNIAQGLELSKQLFASYKTIIEHISNVQESFQQIEITSNQQNVGLEEISKAMEEVTMRQEESLEVLLKTKEQSDLQNELAHVLDEQSTQLKQQVALYQID